MKTLITVGFLETNIIKERNGPIKKLLKFVNRGPINFAIYICVVIIIDIIVALSIILGLGEPS